MRSMVVSPLFQNNHMPPEKPTGSTRSRPDYGISLYSSSALTPPRPVSVRRSMPGFCWRRSWRKCILVSGCAAPRTFHIFIFIFWGVRKLARCGCPIVGALLMDPLSLGSMAPRFPWFVDTGSLHSCGMSSPSSLPFLRRAGTLSLRTLVGLSFVFWFSQHVG